MLRMLFKVKQMCHRYHQRAQFSNKLLFLSRCDISLFEAVANKLKKLTLAMIDYRREHQIITCRTDN